MTFPGGDQVTRGFIGLHDEQLIQTTAPYNSPIERKLNYDAVGRLRREMREPMGDGRLFGYDGLGRLRADTMIAGDGYPACTTTRPDPNDEGAQCNYDFWLYWAVTWVDSFAYDSAGNRTDHGGMYGPGNRIQAFDSCTYSTDEDGNVTQRSCPGETVTIAWNADHRPNRFTVNGTTIDLFYDPAGRLVQRSVNGSRQAYFLWDGDNLFAELDGSGEKRAEYSYYPGQDNPHAVIKGSTPYYAHTDGRGNVVAVTNGSQQLAWSYEYDAWGQPTDGGGPDTLDNRARFKGALWLGPEAEFYYMRNRWYEPRTGRFLSEDPIGLEGGLNLYAFAGNDPVNGRDPTGLFHCKDYDDNRWLVEWHPDDDGDMVIDDVLDHWCEGGQEDDEASRPGGWQQPESPLPLQEACAAGVAGALFAWVTDFALLAGTLGAGFVFKGAVTSGARHVALRGAAAGGRAWTRSMLARGSREAARLASAGRARAMATVGDALAFEGSQIPVTAAFGLLTTGDFHGSDFVPFLGAWNMSKTAYAACSALAQGK